MTKKKMYVIDGRGSGFMPNNGRVTDWYYPDLYGDEWAMYGQDNDLMSGQLLVPGCSLAMALAREMCRTFSPPGDCDYRIRYDVLTLSGELKHRYQRCQTWEVK